MADVFIATAQEKKMSLAPALNLFVDSQSEIDNNHVTPVIISHHEPDNKSPQLAKSKRRGTRSHLQKPTLAIVNETLGITRFLDTSGLPWVAVTVIGHDGEPVVVARFMYTKSAHLFLRSLKRIAGHLSVPFAPENFRLPSEHPDATIHDEEDFRSSPLRKKNKRRPKRRT